MMTTKKILIVELSNEHEKFNISYMSPYQKESSLIIERYDNKGDCTHGIPIPNDLLLEFSIILLKEHENFIKFKPES